MSDDKSMNATLESLPDGGQFQTFESLRRRDWSLRDRLRAWLYRNVLRPARTTFCFPGALVFRLRNGFWRGEPFDLYMNLARFILPRLREFRRTTYSHPSDMTHVTWELILDKMIFSLEACVEENLEPWPDFLSRPVDTREFDEFHDQVREGLTLFGRYFRHLWI